MILCQDNQLSNLIKRKEEFTEKIGELLSISTGDHLAVKNLLICLYDKPLMHIDLKFLEKDELPLRTEDPVILWQRDSLFSKLLTLSRPHIDEADIQFIENHFWIWLHYACSKLERGEVFEVVFQTGFLRIAIATLYYHSYNISPRGVRRFEQLMPNEIAAFSKTVPTYTYDSCHNALCHLVDLYVSIRNSAKLKGVIDPNTKAEKAVSTYLDSLKH